MAESKTRFYSPKYPALKTVIAGRKIEFIDHEFATSDPIIIKGLDKLASVQRYEKHVKKEQLKFNKEAVKDIEAEIKQELTAKLEKELVATLKKELTPTVEKELKKELEPAIKEQLKKDLAEEVRLELEAEFIEEKEKEVKKQGKSK